MIDLDRHRSTHTIVTFKGLGKYDGFDYFIALRYILIQVIVSDFRKIILDNHNQKISV